MYDLRLAHYLIMGDVTAMWHSTQPETNAMFLLRRSNYVITVDVPISISTLIDVCIDICVMMSSDLYALADPGGAASMPPQQDPFLSFSHTFLPKSVCIGGQHSHQWEILDPPLVQDVQSLFLQTCPI